MQFSTAQFLLGLFFGALIGYLAWRARSLSRSGAWAATVTGGLIFGLGGFPWAILLLTFFISSSALSRAYTGRKAGLGEKFSKGSQRDWGQVLANGGLGAMLVVVQALLPNQNWAWLAYAGAMAAVNADTWATELGVLSASPPRLITSGKIVERGASGGVTVLGTLAALAGAALIGVFTGLFSPDIGFGDVLVVVSFAGLAGSMLDSVLGATVQAIYYCDVCEKETERHPYHTCGSGTRRVRGWSWLNNDLVNFTASIFGAIVSAGVWYLTV